MEHLAGQSSIVQFFVFISENIRFVFSGRACRLRDGLILQCHLSQSSNPR